MTNFPVNHADDKACMSWEKRQDPCGLEKLEKVFW